MRELSLRQVHLDFHTSEAIEDVAGSFDPKKFAWRLKEAHIDSVTCFTRCHHGWLYYDSKRFPERIHPHLQQRDLFGLQLEACHREGINVVGYLPLQWDHLAAEQHPEWIVVDSEGRQNGNGPFEAGFYRGLCLNTNYVDYVKEQVKEVLEGYTVDGLFLDIINTRECCCTACRRDMLSLGLNPSDREERKTFTHKMQTEFTLDMSSFIRELAGDISIFYNYSHLRTSHRDNLSSFSHLELESLPTGGWGYWDFPVTVRYARPLGLPVLGMTGKFHTSWGDFQSLKHRHALEYECFRSLAFTSGCSIGDQLPPSGELSNSTYELIGTVYKEIEKKEEWCKGAIAVSQIGVISPDRFEGTDRGGISEDIRGCTRMLTELSYQFDIIDELAVFQDYKLLILPDHVILTETLERKLQEYLSTGGKVIGSYRSAMKRKGSGRLAPVYMLDELSVQNEEEYDVDFLIPEAYNSQELCGQSHVLYMAALPSEVSKELEVLNWSEGPYFKRSWKHFCSHRHAPDSGELVYPAVIRKKESIHLMHPVFTIYDKYDAYWLRTLVDDLLQLLLGYRQCRHDGPSTVVMTMNEQQQKNRYILHLLHYIPERRGSEFDTVSDIIPLYKLNVEVCVEKRPGLVKLVPEEKEFAFHSVKTGEGSYMLSFEVPQIIGHQMVVIESGKV